MQAGSLNFNFVKKYGKGRHVYVRAWPRPSRSAWAETLQTHGFPVQAYGGTSNGHNFDSKVWIKIPSSQTSYFDPFCVPMYKLCPQVLPIPQ